jgi:nucleoside-diphosphate-sugar epimerase
MARCLVTGGAGFIGSNLVDALLEEGHDVRVLDNFSTGDRRNLLHVARDIEIVEGDLRSFERTLTAARGQEIVFHQAALPSVPRSIEDPLTSSSVNVTGTLNILLAARDMGVRRVVYASSSSVYGAVPVEVKREDLAVAPLSPYGVAKYAGEAYCSSFYEVYGLETVSLRYFNVFGPRQSPISEYAAVVPNFISAALLDERPVVFGDGLQARDFTFVANVVQANVAAATTEKAAGQVFNIGCGERTSVLALLGAVAEISGRELEARHLPARAGDIRVSVADIGKASAVLGYVPAVGLREGLRRGYELFLADKSIISRIRERRQWTAAAVG